MFQICAQPVFLVFLEELGFQVPDLFFSCPLPQKKTTSRLLTRPSGLQIPLADGLMESTVRLGNSEEPSISLGTVVCIACLKISGLFYLVLKEELTH